jgi:predicted phage terminase large subunit-like protein
MTTEPEPEIDDESEPPKPVKIRVKIHNRGPALWPERFSAKKLRQIAKTLGSYFFGCLYQGSPAPEGGGLFKKSWFKYYKVHGEFIQLDGRTFQLAHCRRFGTCDLAFSVKSTSDFTCVFAWAVTPDCDLVLLDMHRERMTGDQLVPACRNMIEKWNLDYMGIEDVAAQTLVVQTARKNGLTVRALKANLDKITRCIPAQVRMEAGQIYFPVAHAELANLEHELMTFPNGAHDDAVDVLAYAALEVQKRGPAAIPPEERERMERERLERVWLEKVKRDQEAQQDWDDPRWWDGAWLNQEEV